MQSGFRRTTRAMANASGNMVFSPADKEVCAKLAAPDVDEQWADEHVRRALEEIRGTWTARETELRTWTEPEVELRTIRRIDFRREGMRIA
jgi:hypothetical protein